MRRNKKNKLLRNRNDTALLLRRRRFKVTGTSILVYVVGLAFCVFITFTNYSLTMTTTTTTMTATEQKQLPSIPSKRLLPLSPVNTAADADTDTDYHVVEQKIKKIDPKDLKLPTPIIVVGLPKAGTTSIYGYFKCGLDPKKAKISHYNCNDRGHHKNTMSCGKRMRRNLTKLNKPAFDNMDKFHIYTELDAQEYNGGMTVPQWEFLDGIHNHFPNATWILNLRNPHDWLNSVNRWQDLRQRFIDNPFQPNLPRGKGKNDDDMINFYLAQAERIRNFVRDHPSHTLVEVQIDGDKDNKNDAGQVMEDAFGISKVCWKKRNSNINGTAIWVDS